MNSVSKPAAFESSRSRRQLRPRKRTRSQAPSEPSHTKKRKMGSLRKQAANELEDLKTFFLSSEAEHCCTFDETQDQVPEHPSSAIVEFLQLQVPDLNALLDRRGRIPAYKLLLLTYEKGLPLYNQLPKVQQHTIFSCRYVIHQLISKALSTQATRKYARRLVENFQACQAQQAQVSGCLAVEAGC